MTPRQAKILARFHGPRCAGWLVRRMKDAVHIHGGFEVQVDRATVMPPWFYVTVAYLRELPKRWRVQVISHPTRVCYRFWWLGWRGRLAGGAVLAVAANRRHTLAHA
jgi:hypothetical protein